jgi:three-Cys-motif partner protein
MGGRMGKRKRKDRWPELCHRVLDDDNLPTRPDVGAWTEDKLYYWNRYIEITTSAMVGNPKWRGGIVYVDIFAGPGICTLRESGRRIPGSPLLAAWAPKPFDRILLCEKYTELAAACKRRLDATPIADRVIMFVGDCNLEINRIEEAIPKSALVLAFVDPEGLHVHFDTIATLTNERRVDLLVLFADRMDIVRNVDLYASQDESNLDRFLGSNLNWRQKWAQLTNRDPGSICKFFTELYKDQLVTELGYTALTDQVMKSSRSALYRVIYASKHPLGLKFWKEISRIDRSGQRGLFSD